MSSALLFLGSHTIRNSLARRVRQLRNPRYLAALIIGGGYLWFALFRQRPGHPRAVPDAAWLELGATVLGAVLVIWTWLFATERRALVFTPAEVLFLFPAPLTRRTLIHYKLWRAQLMVLLNTLIWTLLLSSERLGAGSWFRAVSLWVILSTLQLHRLGASFVRTSLVQHGARGLRRLGVPLIIAALLMIGLIALGIGAVPIIGAAAHQGPGEVIDALVRASHRPVPATLLWPFRVMARALAATTAAAWLAAIGPAVAILIAHYVWVIRSDAAFEEAAADASFRRAREISERRQGAPATASAGGSRPLYRLGPTGNPAAAIFWKNLNMLARRNRVMLGVALAAGLGAVAFIVSLRPAGAAADVIAAMALMYGGILYVGGSQVIRNDLRSDLLHLDILRTYPVTGAALVWAESAASAVITSAVQIGLFIVGYLALFGQTDTGLSLAERSGILVVAVIVTPAINAVGSTIQNGMALLFPAWVHLGPHRATGVEAVGQSMLGMLLQFLLLVVALLGPLIAAAAVFGLLRGLLGWIAAAPALLALIAGLGIELFLLLQWLGDVLDRTDATVVAADRTT